MGRVIQETRTLETSDSADREVEVADRNEAEPHHATWTVARIIYLILGILETLLAFRFVLSLLGANKGNVFADLIYGITFPFVAPFFGLFNYQVQYGVSRFEIETLVAMAVYALVAWGIVRILTINSRDHR